MKVKQNKGMILVGMLLCVPVVLAMFSPYLAFRPAIYIIAGFAGILTLPLLAIQPILPTRMVDLNPIRARRLHRIIGPVLILLTLVHIGALYLTSPTDAVDALLLRAPTLFSVFGVIALWALFITASLAMFRKSLPKRLWNSLHLLFNVALSLSIVVHALQIEGAMEPVSKWIICSAILATLCASMIWTVRKILS